MSITRSQSATLRRHLKPGDLATVAAEMGKYTERYVRMVAYGQRANKEILQALLDRAERNKTEAQALKERLAALNA